jgi:hypothetical protein
MKNNISIHLAQQNDVQTVVTFFEQHINKESDRIYSEEFLCPYWVTWAINKKQIIIAKNDNKIIWALRFYQQKRKNIVSLYQFAILNNWRSKNILKKMLQSINCQTIESRCHINTKFNDYYKKTGRTLIKTDDLWNLWQLKI